MRASTVFALAMSLLIGLAAAAGAKYAGLFEKKQAESTPTPPPPVVKALVARTNLFVGITVTNTQVMVRDLSVAEQEAYKARYGANWHDRLMAPMTSAAHLRTPLRNILADEILMEKDFAPAVLPDELSKQLDPNTRAVTVYVMKEHCAGGTIRVGEFVDVLLTTKINYDDKEELRTACIARACKVVMKRNTPWQVMAADPDDKPLPFTLQANPYRAALIQYAHTMGQISLQPVPAPPKSTGSFTDLSSPEYATEDKKVEEITQGTRLIGTEDLVRIFKVPPPSPKPLPPQQVVIQHLTGVSQAAPTVFYVNGQFNPMTGATASAVGSSPASQPVQPAGGVSAGSTRAAASPAATGQPAGATFQLPSATGQTNCPECEAKKKAELEAFKKMGAIVNPGK